MRENNVSINFLYVALGLIAYNKNKRGKNMYINVKLENIINKF